MTAVAAIEPADTQILQPHRKPLSVITYLNKERPCPHNVRVRGNVLLHRAIIDQRRQLREARMRQARVLFQWADRLEHQPGSQRLWSPYYATWTPPISGVEQHAFEDKIVLVTDVYMNNEATHIREFMVFDLDTLASSDQDPLERTDSLMHMSLIEHALGHWEVAHLARNPATKEEGLVSRFYDWVAEFMPDPDDAAELRAKDSAWRHTMPSGWLTDDGFKFWQRRAPELTRLYVWVEFLRLYVSASTIELMQKCYEWIKLDSAKPEPGQLLS